MAGTVALRRLRLKSQTEFDHLEATALTQVKKVLTLVLVGKTPETNADVSIERSIKTDVQRALRSSRTNRWHFRDKEITCHQTAVMTR